MSHRPRSSSPIRRALCLVAVVALLAGLFVAVSPTNSVAAAAPVLGGSVRTGGAAAALGGPADFGSTAPGVAIAPTASGNGYLVVDSAGAVFAFGDAGFRGGLSGIRLNRSIVGVAPTPTGSGYWLVASDGGVFSFGDARFHGSTGAIRLNQPIVGMAPTTTGNGYWLVASDGGVFAFGDARFHGSSTGVPDVGTTVSIARTATGGGYWLVDDRGVVSAFGDAPAVAAVADVPVGTYLVAAAVRPQADGVWGLFVPSRADARFPVPAGSGTGRRIVYSNSQQRVWLVEDNGRVFDSYLVSGRQGVPAPGTYSVFSKSEVARSGNLRLDHMVRFTWGRTLAIGFHAIPSNPAGQPSQSLDELGQFRSAGCIRQDPAKAAELYAWAPVGTKVVVLP
jgi:hypothetical protein